MASSGAPSLGILPGQSTATEMEAAWSSGRGRSGLVTHPWHGKLERKRGIATGELAYVQKRTKRTPKATLPSPESQHFFRFREGISDSVYPDLDDFFEDVARVYREELEDLAARGATYVQLDCVSIPLLCDPKIARPSRPEATIWRSSRATSTSSMGRSGPAHSAHSAFTSPRKQPGEVARRGRL
jgi:methionine synthase II (cobalamin-independent)